tara:strand:+ start:3353 stop:3688 length:336 start_codon:yes stop_codon:yes gene_type:complete
MARRLTLTKHLMEAMDDLKEGMVVSVTEDTTTNYVNDINNFLNEMANRDSRKILTAKSVVKDRFGSKILEDIMCDISEDDDYLNESINKELNKRITNIINEWLVEKLKNNG